MTTHGDRNDLGMAPPGAHGPHYEPGRTGVGPGRSVDQIIAEIRRSLEPSQTTGGTDCPGWHNHPVPSQKLGRRDAGGNGYLDRGAMAIARATNLVTEFYAEHRKCRWCINVTGASVAIFLMLA